MTLDDLRSHAIARSLFPPTTLKRAIERFGFVQADPIRSPARAQDLTLRHRVRDYRAGDLERRYTTLGIEEDVFINYGFVSRAVYELMHPREKPPMIPDAPRLRAHKVLAFVRERGEVLAREGSRPGEVAVVLVERAAAGLPSGHDDAVPRAHQQVARRTVHVGKCDLHHAALEERDGAPRGAPRFVHRR